MYFSQILDNNLKNVDKDGNLLPETQTSLNYTTNGNGVEPLTPSVDNEPVAPIEDTEPVEDTDETVDVEPVEPTEPEVVEE